MKYYDISKKDYSRIIKQLLASIDTKTPQIEIPTEDLLQTEGNEKVGELVEDIKDKVSLNDRKLGEMLDNPETNPEDIASLFSYIKGILSVLNSRASEDTLLALLSSIGNKTKNLRNGKEAILVNTQSIESSYSNVFSSDVSDEKIITPDSGNKIEINDVFIMAAANIGEVAIDFEDSGKAIARLYTSQFMRATLNNMTIQDNEDNSVLLTANASGGDLFVLINYIEV